MSEEITHQYQLASLWRRAWAAGIDQLLLSIPMAFMMAEYVTPMMDIEAMSQLAQQFMVEYTIVGIVYHALFTALYGASLGKQMMKIKVIELVHPQGHPRWLCAFNRSIFRIISEVVFYIGFVIAWFDPYRRTLHDFTAKTLVVHA